MSKLERREFRVTGEDHMGVFDFKDKPGELAIVVQAQPDESGVAQQRSIYFPDDEFICAALIRQLMEVSGVRSASLNKKGEFKWKWSPKE